MVVFKVSEDAEILLQNSGTDYRIKSPWTNSLSPLYMHQILPNEYMFWQSGRLHDMNTNFIDFIWLKKLNEFRRWEVTDDGEYISQSVITLDQFRNVRDCVQVRNTWASACRSLQAYNNDYSIYSFIYEVDGATEANRFLQDEVSDIPAMDGSISAKLVLIISSSMK